MNMPNLDALQADPTPEEEEAFIAENPDLYELSQFVDGELPDERRKAFLQKLLASEELQSAMEDYMALDLVGASAGPMAVAALPARDNVAPIRSRRGWVASLSVLASAAALVLVIGAMSQGPLEVEVRNTSEVLRSARALVGDEVVVSTNAWPGGKRALRVYADESELVFSCSKSDSCRGELFGMEATWTPDSPGIYRIVFLQSLFASIPPSTGDMLSDVEAWAGLDSKTTIVRVGARND